MMHFFNSHSLTLWLILLPQKIFFRGWDQSISHVLMGRKCLRIYFYLSIMGVKRASLVHIMIWSITMKVYIPNINNLVSYICLFGFITYFKQSGSAMFSIPIKRSTHWLSIHGPYVLPWKADQIIQPRILQVRYSTSKLNKSYFKKRLWMDWSFIQKDVCGHEEKRRRRRYQSVVDRAIVEQVHRLSCLRFIFVAGQVPGTNWNVIVVVGRSVCLSSALKKLLFTQFLFNIF